MAKTKRNKPSFNEILEQVQHKDLDDVQNNIIITNDKIELSQDEYNNQKIKEKNLNDKNLALSFKYITENKDFNFNYFKKNKSELEVFTSKLDSLFKKITSFTIKDLSNPVFKDRISFKDIYEGAYQNSQKVFEKTEELISVEFGSKQNGRMILFYDGNEETGDNILYVLLFQNSFNKPAYYHGDKRKRQ